LKQTSETVCTDGRVPDVICYALPVLWMTSCFHMALMWLDRSGHRRAMPPITPCISDIDSSTACSKRFDRVARQGRSLPSATVTFLVRGFLQRAATFYSTGSGSAHECGVFDFFRLVTPRSSIPAVAELLQKQFETILHFRSPSFILHGIITEHDGFLWSFRMFLPT